MWPNILIAISVGVLSYVLIIYLDHQSQMQYEQEQPVPAHASFVAGSTAPDFTFKTLEGQNKTLRDFAGRTVILNFWASWCTPCIKEFPTLLNLAEKHKDHVTLIALSSDHDEAAMLRFLETLEQKGFGLKRSNVMIARDESGFIAADLFQTYRLPETIIIDPTQKMQRKLVGANWDAREISDFLANKHF